MDDNYIISHMSTGVFWLVNMSSSARQSVKIPLSIGNISLYSDEIPFPGEGLEEEKWI